MNFDTRTSRSVLPSLRTAAKSALLAAVILLPACGDGVTDPSEQFMIRRPIDSLFGGAATFTASPTVTNSLDFEWEPVSGADRYSLVFAETQSADSMNTLKGDLSNPALTFTITNTQPVDVLINPNGDPDGLRVSVVQFSITSPEFDAALEAAGVPPGGVMNTIYAVVAHRGSRTIRSVEVQRLRLVRQSS